MWDGKEFQSAVAMVTKENCILVVREKGIKSFDVW